MILGYGIIAVPTGIATVGLAGVMRQPSNTQACPNGGIEGHADDARLVQVVWSPAVNHRARPRIRPRAGHPGSEFGQNAAEVTSIPGTPEGLAPIVALGQGSEPENNAASARQ